MSDTDRQPDAIDVFVHTIFELDEAHYDGRVILSTGSRNETTERIRDWLLHRPHDLTRCYAGQAIVARAGEFTQMKGFESYWVIAQVYDVPYELVATIGDGVEDLSFSQAAAFVQRTIREYRADPAAFYRRVHLGS